MYILDRPIFDNCIVTKITSRELCDGLICIQTNQQRSVQNSKHPEGPGKKIKIEKVELQG